MQQIVEWWNNLSLREQTMLALMAFFSLLLLFYFFAYQPVTQAYQQSQQLIELASQDYRWLQQQAQTIEDLRHKSRGALPKLFTLSQLEESVRKQLQGKSIQAAIEVVDNINNVDEGFLKMEISGSAVEVMKCLESLVNSGHKLDMISLQNSGNWLSGIVSIRT